MKTVLLSALCAGLLYLLAWPVPLSPVKGSPPADPGLVGVFAENDRLGAADLVPLPGDAFGPEDLAVAPDGAVYATDHAGVLYRIDGAAPVALAELDGRPLGLAFGPDGALYIADSYRGIMRWSDAGGLELLLGEVGGAPIPYANQLDVAQDGTIYFTNVGESFSPKDDGGTQTASVMTIWEHQRTGYVARLGPNGAVEKVATGFVHTNGVALSPDEDFLVVADTGNATLHKIWLTGARAGQVELLIENLPGYPDNIEAVGDGTYWVAFASTRLATEVLMQYPFLRKVLWRLGPAVRPAPIHHGILMRFDGAGQVLDVLQDPGGKFGVVSGGTVVGDELYVMSLTAKGFGRIDWP